MSRQKGKGMKRKSNWHQSAGEDRRFRRATRRFPKIKIDLTEEKVEDPKPIPVKGKRR